MSMLNGRPADPQYEPYIDKARKEWGGSSPFRLGIVIGRAGVDLPSPYDKGSSGDHHFHEGIEYGRQQRAKEQS